ncbi:MAG: thiamine diphosphokinase, partial [Bacteroidales bacterium]
MKIKHDCIIVANGAFPTDAELKKMIRGTSVIIACDGAVNKLSAEGIEPNFIVGDLDSLSYEMKVKYADLIHHNPDQETNDLTKAINFAK